MVRSDGMNCGEYGQGCGLRGFGDLASEHWDDAVDTTCSVSYNEKRLETHGTWTGYERVERCKCSEAPHSIDELGSVDLLRLH